MGWPGAARDHDTFCVSCHTVVPYALSRPRLRSFAEADTSGTEQKIFEDVETRVRLWDKIAPYYSDTGFGYGKASQSRGTEAVLNAFLLASRDANEGHLTTITRAALKEMWDLQVSAGPGKGAWSWLDNGLEPWEAKDSQFYGAALAAVATGIAPEDYRYSPDISSKIELLRQYLDVEASRQSLINKAVLLWASTKMPGLIDSRERDLIIRDILTEQQKDGGWKLSSNIWPRTWNLHSEARRYLRADWTRQDLNSDGYATGLFTFVLEEVGISDQNPALKNALSWLARNQSPVDGSWPSVSVSEIRNPSSNVGHFMKDAATAYAVLALTRDETASARKLNRLHVPHAIFMGTPALGGPFEPSKERLAGKAGRSARGG